MKKRIQKFAIWLSVCLMSAVTTGCITIFSDPLTVQRDITYSTIDEISLKGDLYFPKSPSASTLNSALPAVLVVHGGGWNKKSGDMSGVSKDLAKAGFVVFNISYRLAPQHLYPAALEDVKAAFIWLKNNASQYSIDTNQISVWGYSAGAHLVLLAALDDDLNVKSIVAGGTPADLTAWPKSPLVTKFLGKTMAEDLELWKKASPIFHVGKDYPPTYLYHGEWDSLVEPDQMDKMAGALKDKGLTVETYTAKYLGHVTTYLLSQESIDRGINFIKKHL